MGKNFFEVNTLLLEFSATRVKVREVCLGNTEVRLTEKMFSLCSLVSSLSEWAVSSQKGQLFVSSIKY